MSEWKEVISSDVLDLISGFAFKSMDFKELPDEDDLPVIKIKNVANGDVNFDKVVYHEVTEKLKKYILKKGDVLIAMTGNHPQAQTQVVGDVSRYKFDKNALLNQRVGKIISKDDNSLDFFYYYFKNKGIKDYLANQSSGSANQANISKDDILGVPIFIPKPEEQRAIASVLSSLDDKIDLLHRQNQTLEQMAETLFRQWFVEEADERWEVKKLKEVVDIGIGRTPPRKEFHWFSKSIADVKWVSIKDLGGSGIFVFDTSEYLTEEAVEKFHIPIIPPGTVLLSFKMTLGRVAITTENMLSNEAIAHFKFNEKTPFSKEFLYFYLKTYPYETLGSTSSIVTSINSGMIKNMEAIIPNDDTLSQFENHVIEYFDKIKSNQTQIRTLTALRDTLLPKLMSGEVRIS